MNTIQSLRKSGIKVRVLHERWLVSPATGKHKELAPLYLIRGDKLQNEIHPCGGKTTIQATTKDGRDFEAIATCSKKDNFNRHIAINKAIGRLVAKMNANAVIE